MILVSKPKIVVDIAPRKPAAVAVPDAKEGHRDTINSGRVFEFVPYGIFQSFYDTGPAAYHVPHAVLSLRRCPGLGQSSLCNCFRVFLAQWARLLSWKGVGTFPGILGYGIRFDKTCS